MTTTETTVSKQVQEYGAGNCVAFWEKNGYDDSDFFGKFAVAQEDGTYKFISVETGSTRHAGGFIAHVDATDEVKAAYEAARAEVLAKMEADFQARKAAEVTKGAYVTVVKAVTRGKNKVAAGEAGIVFWKDVDGFDPGNQWAAKYGRTMSYRVGIELFDGTKVFISEANVRVQGFEGEDLPYLDRTVDYLIAANWPPVR